MPGEEFKEFNGMPMRMNTLIVVDLQLLSLTEALQGQAANEQSSQTVLT